MAKLSVEMISYTEYGEGSFSLADRKLMGNMSTEYYLSLVSVINLIIAD